MPIPNGAAPLEKVSARTKIYEALCGWIIDGTLQPGEKVSDSEIAVHFEVSRTPVREAMQMLSDQRLLEIVPGKETRVAPIDADETKKIYGLLAVLHSEALTQALPRITNKDIARLCEINDRMRNAVAKRDPVASLRCDREFHAVILAIADNYFLSDFAEKLLLHVLRVEHLHYHHPEIKIASVEEHERIIRALQCHDAAAAIAETKNNWIHFGLDLSALRD